MDLETKFYELQDRYQTLINDYEQLKEKYEADSDFVPSEMWLEKQRTQ